MTKRKIYSCLIAVLVIGIMVWVFLPKYIGWPPSKTEDTNNLYPDKIEYAYLVDKVGVDNVEALNYYKNANEKKLGSLRNFSRHNMLVPLSMTNNYPENETYTMSISLRNTFLHRNSPSYKYKFLSPYSSEIYRYRTSHGHSLPCDYRVHPDLYESSCSLMAPQNQPITFKNETATCRAYNPHYTEACNSSSGTFEVSLKPRETSVPFYLDFQIPFRDEKYIDTKEQTFTVGLMRGEDNYYPIPIQEVIDCRGELMVKDEQCHILPFSN